MQFITNIFSKYQPLAILVLRLTFGIHLLIYAGDNVFSYARMLDFRDFLHQYQVPYPLAAAFLSVYVQFTAGIFLILGYQVRLTGVFICINFIFALFIAHIGQGQTYQQYFPAAQLVAIGFFFVLNGAGSYSVDAYRNHKTRDLATPATVK